jgi:hypothetical protein
VKPRFEMRMALRMKKRCRWNFRRCGILAGPNSSARELMSREEAITLASRTLAVLIMVWTLTDISYLPGSIYAFLHYSNVELSSQSATEYYRHANLMSLSFLVVRIIGYLLLMRWLFKDGPEVAELLLPSFSDEIVVEPEGPHKLDA